jgi:transposase
LDNVLRRGRWIVHRKLEGWRSIEVATALRVDRRTVHRWRRVYRKYGREGLALKSRIPHKRYETPRETVDFVLQLRREKHWAQTR